MERPLPRTSTAVHDRLIASVNRPDSGRGPDHHSASDDRSAPRARERPFETSASTTAAVHGTTFDVPLATRVNERASPAGARRPRARRSYTAIVRSIGAASPAGDDAATTGDSGDPAATARACPSGTYPRATARSATTSARSRQDATSSSSGSCTGRKACPDHGPVQLLADQRQVDELLHRGLELVSDRLPFVRLGQRRQITRGCR
jgi:hypothetical protein